MKSASLISCKNKFFNLRKKLDEFSFRSFGFIVKAVMMNIKQGYLEICKELAMFLEVHNMNKKLKKNALNSTNIQVANENKNKTLIENNSRNEETALRTYDEITSIENNFNNRNKSNISFINFGNSKLLNVLNKSDRILSELEVVIENKSSI